MIFEFEGFRLLMTSPADLLLATEWSSADPFHGEAAKPSFWIEQGIGVTSSFLLYDALGPVFFFKLCLSSTKELEIHIQFGPEHQVARRRVMTGLMAGWRWLERRIRGLSFEVVYFKSSNPVLIYFCQRRLGFEWDGRRLQRRLNRDEERKQRQDGEQENGRHEKGRVEGGAP